MIISYEIGISFPRVDLHRKGKQQNALQVRDAFTSVGIILRYNPIRMIFKPEAHFGHSFGCPTKPFKIITRLNARINSTYTTVTTFNYGYYAAFYKYIYILLDTGTEKKKFKSHLLSRKTALRISFNTLFFLVLEFRLKEKDHLQYYSIDIVYEISICTTFFFFFCIVKIL